MARVIEVTSQTQSGEITISGFPFLHICRKKGLRTLNGYSDPLSYAEGFVCLPVSRNRPLPLEAWNRLMTYRGHESALNPFQDKGLGIYLFGLPGTEVVPYQELRPELTPEKELGRLSDLSAEEANYFGFLSYQRNGLPYCLIHPTQRVTIIELALVSL